ncbi:hypothetical protein V6N13_115094 [Hibiscus sabdariffa]|uniref:Uncharacterized protein n=1 Tax=Hibiscus sabdariffa TaxID=183260 RepID=A0ABR2U3T2_9ROSI
MGNRPISGRTGQSSPVCTTMRISTTCVLMNARRGSFRYRLRLWQGPRKEGCLQLVVGITFTGASAFIHFQAISNGERGGPGLIRRQDLFVLG